MAMSLKDFRQLEKLMTQTTSDNDHEALAALRLANVILKRYNYTWADAFARLVKVDNGMPEVEDGGDSLPRDNNPTASKDAAAIRSAFEAVKFKELPEYLENLIQSFHEQFTQKGYLSAKQQGILFKAAEQ
jgi:hypothetical protein